MPQRKALEAGFNGDWLDVAHGEIPAISPARIAAAAALI
jgi:hypothetical protein